MRTRPGRRAANCRIDDVSRGATPLRRGRRYPEERLTPQSAGLPRGTSTESGRGCGTLPPCPIRSMSSSWGRASPVCTSCTDSAPSDSGSCSSRPGPISAASGTGTATPAPGSTHTSRCTSTPTRRCGRTGTGPSGTRDARSCGRTSITLPTAGTCGRTSVWALGCHRPGGPRRHDAGRSPSATAPRSTPRGSSCAPVSRRSRSSPTCKASMTSEERCTTPRPGPRKGST